LLRHGQGICGLGAPAVNGVRFSICATTTLQWCDQSKVCATFLKVQDEMGSII